MNGINVFPWGTFEAEYVCYRGLMATDGFAANDWKFQQILMFAD